LTRRPLTSLALAWCAMSKSLTFSLGQILIKTPRFSQPLAAQKTMMNDHDDEDYERRRQEAARTCRGRRRVSIFVICIYIVLGILYGRRSHENELVTALQDQNETFTAVDSDNATVVIMNETVSDDEDSNKKGPKRDLKVLMSHKA
jgi:hypothetical protein